MTYQIQTKLSSDFACFHADAAGFLHNVPMVVKSRMAANIIEAVRRFYDLKPDEILSEARHKNVCEARQVAMWLIRQRTELSHEQIAKMMGGRHHSTAIHSCQKIDEERRVNGLGAKISRIESTIRE